MPHDQCDEDHGNDTRVNRELISDNSFRIFIVGSLIAIFVGCGGSHATNGNRKNLAPWDKLTPGAGIKYIAKFEQDNGLDPIYLAKIEYKDDASLQKIIDTFGLVAHESDSPPLSCISVLKNKPTWCPLTGVTQVFAYPESSEDYAANLWINSNDRTAIIERSWW